MRTGSDRGGARGARGARLAVGIGLVLGAGGIASASAAGAVVHPERWPVLYPAQRDSAALERRVERILAQMTLRQKVGQLIQADISGIRPRDLLRWPVGAILNGGNSKPNGAITAAPEAWLSLANRFYLDSMRVPGVKRPIPVMWGMDAVHGANDIYGATVFPQNVGLGAADDPALVRRIGRATAEEVRAVGVDWTFGPTVAVVSDMRWGRTYESYSQDPHRVAALTRAMVLGLQGAPNTVHFLDAEHVLATPKHFIGDGGTEGVDQGDNRESEAQLIHRDAAGYEAALGAGVQVIMASFSSWQGEKMLANYGLLTSVLKRRWHFDGFVVGDWNAQGQVPGCTDVSCARAVNAGLDMFMAPDDWKALFKNTLAEVRSGQIPRRRLDAAVRRILRVKLRDRLWAEGPPAQRRLAGRFGLLGDAAHRALAREAVRESLVLLKNDHHLLPLAPHERVLVAGDGANNIPMQCGGWTLTWQGTDTTNADFPHGESIWQGIQSTVRAAGGSATLSIDGHYRRRPDVAIVVYGEHPYAEFEGDVHDLAFSGAAAERDLHLLQRLRAAHIPVVSVFLSGRPLWVNPQLDASTAFVAAWLPGSEGEGVADVLFRKPSGQIRYDFHGTLPFAWPRTPLQFGLDVPGKPLFPLGYGLRDASDGNLPHLSVRSAVALAPAVSARRFFSAGHSGAGWHWAVLHDGMQERIPHGVGRAAAGAVTLSALDWRRQEDARRLSWTGAAAAAVVLTGATPVNLTRQANGQMVLALHYRLEQPPASSVTLSMACGAHCAGAVPLTNLLRRAPVGRWQQLRIPLACFARAGANMSRIDTPFAIRSTGRLALAVADVRVQSDTSGALACPH
ncbi:MAG: exo 1,3/1,4-beta-D-glucan glucohydrolase [Gammaproteobacteria bacterium]|nr:exo 1,3/1,4-beta-D-glucan glucohydrolase [Gammaproteobacteria bacterium]